MNGGVSIACRVAAPVLLGWALSSPPAFGDGESGVMTPRLDLTLDEAIGLALQNNRDLLDARLERTIQAFSLEVAEDRYRPTVSIGQTLRVDKENDLVVDDTIQA